MESGEVPIIAIDFQVLKGLARAPGWRIFHRWRSHRILQLSVLGPLQVVRAATLVRAHLSSNIMGIGVLIWHAAQLVRKPACPLGGRVIWSQARTSVIRGQLVDTA
jgi:hypothetical protein